MVPNGIDILSGQTNYDRGTIGNQLINAWASKAITVQEARQKSAIWINSLENHNNSKPKDKSSLTQA
jgi:hypothetical protein